MDRREFGLGLAATAVVAATPVAAATKPAYELDFIMPDIRWPDRAERTVHDGAYTIRYRYMNRVRRRPGGDTTIECAEVGSERYAAWLAERTDGRPYPPHISFGGAVVAGKGDPTFYDRWVAYAATLS